MARKRKQAASEGVLVQKPKTTIYTTLLIVAFLALLLGCIFMYLEQVRYGGFGAISGG